MVVNANFILFDDGRDLEKEVKVENVAFVFVSLVNSKLTLKYETDTFKIVHESDGSWYMYFYSEGLKVATINDCNEVERVIIQTKELSYKCIK